MEHKYKVYYNDDRFPFGERCKIIEIATENINTWIENFENNNIPNIIVTKWICVLNQ
jgi:hypothetical protein